MPCPTCDHTLQGLPGPEGQRLWWCPRCGTLVSEAKGFRAVDVPSLANRVRAVGPVEAGCSAHPGVLRCAVPAWSWGAICEAAGVRAGG